MLMPILSDVRFVILFQSLFGVEYVEFMAFYAGAA